MSLFLVTALALQPMLAMPPAEQAGVDLFADLCVANFGDREGFNAAVAATGISLDKLPPVEGEPDMGDAWSSDELRIQYAQSDWLPKDLPSPQCSITFLGADLDYEAMKAILEERMGLATEKTKGAKKGRPSTRYDWNAEDGSKRRLFFSRRPSAKEGEYSITLLGLR